MVDWPLSYREAQFTPAEIVTCAGLSHALQRSWRAQGLLPPRTTGHKRFSPAEVAEIRVMVTLRAIGLSLRECREAAEAAAPSVLFIALANYDRLCLEVEAAPERARRFKETLGWETDERCQLVMSGAGDARTTYVAVRGGGYELLADPSGLAAKHVAEAFAMVDLEAVAEALVKAAPRPLFTLVVPKSYI